MPFHRLTKDEARPRMAQLVAEYQHRAVELEAARSPYTELEARGQFIDRFLNILGWDVHNRDNQPQVQREVVLERVLNESDDGGRPDYRLRNNGRDRLPVEAKKPSVRLSVAASPARQARSYGFSLSLPAAALTNMAETAIYDTTFPPEDGDGPDVGLVPGGRFSTVEYVTRFDELWDRLSYDSVTSEQYFALYSYTEPPRGSSPFDRSFLAQFREWRLILASDIATSNPDLPAAEVGRRTQRLLNALLFLRVCEDRNIGRYEALLASAHADTLMDAFRAADRAFNAGLFDVLKTTACSQTALTAVIREMYWPRTQFAFGVLEPEILAAVYEQYLAERVEVDARRGVFLVQKPELTHAGGVVPTPGWVVSDLVSSALAPQLSAGQPVPDKLRVLDLSCGSGTFLTEALKQLIEAEELAGRPAGLTERAELAARHLYGVDIDGAAVEVAKLSVLLGVLGEVVVDTSRARDILPDLSQNLLVGNSLIESNFDAIVPGAAAIPQRRAAASPLDLTLAFHDVLEDGGFDIIVGNPPYVRIQVLAEFMPDQLAYFQDARSGLVAARAGNFDVYQLFIERAFKFLSSDGYLAYIVPNRFTNLIPAATMRGLLGPRLQRLTHFGEHQVFEGRATYTALVVAGPRSTDPATFQLVRDLQAYRNSGTASVVQVARHALTADPWPIADEARTKAFAKMEQGAVAHLGDPGCVKIFVGVQTSADPLYFITQDPKKSTADIVRFRDVRGVDREIERTILRPAIKDRTLEPYGRGPEPDMLAIFPYDVQPPLPGRKRGSATVFDEPTMKARFPKALAYFIDFRSALERDRNVSPPPGDSFWAYGRSQSLTKLDDPKLIVRTLSLTPQYMVDNNGLLVPGGGDGGPYYLLRPEDACPYSLNVLQAILSHPAVDAFIASRGRAYRGAYVVHRKAFMEAIPLPRLDAAQQRAIEDVVTEMQTITIGLRAERDSAIRTTLTGRFSVLRTNLNDSIAGAYGLDPDDIAAVIGD